MRTILITICSLMLMLPCLAQVSWFPVGAKWHYDYSSFGSQGLTTLEVLHEDTLIASHIYKKILSTTVTGTAPDYLDTVTEVLYVFEENQVVHGYDHFIGSSLLYDFNAEVGDTIEMYFGGLSLSPFVVDSIGEIEMNGSLLTFQDIRFPSPFEPGQFGEMRMIEGLGSIQSHLFHSHTIYVPFDGPSYHIRCYTDENFGEVNLSYNQVDCDYIQGSTSTTEDIKEPIKVYPNPTADYINLQMDGSPIDKYVVTDLLGTIQIQDRNDGGTILKIDLGRLENGFYILSGFDKVGNTVLVEKITKFGN